MKKRYLDPNDPKAVPTLPFVLVFDGGEGKGEADCLKSLAAFVLEGYEDVDDEFVACAMRMQEAKGAAIWADALYGGVPVRVEDAAPDGPVVVWESDKAKAAPPEEVIVVRTDCDYVWLAGMHNLGAVEIWEREDARVFRNPAPRPKSCKECAFLGEEDGKPLCLQFMTDLEAYGGEAAAGCLDGIIKGALGSEGAPYVRVDRAAVPPERLRIWARKAWLPPQA